MDVCKPTLMSKKLKKLLSVLFLLSFLMLILWLRISGNYSEDLSYYSPSDELLLDASIHGAGPVKVMPCTMATCFDFSKCSSKEFRVYVYPLKDQDKVSSNYAKILQSIFLSRYYTNDPNQACIFVPSLDPLDRDKLSTDFQRLLEKKLKGLPYWNNGQNHLIFNLYSGTYPDYKDTLDIDTGKAIIVKASVSSETFRANFDISFPLISKVHPLRSSGFLPSSKNVFPFRRKYRISFKGKRYLLGIGSETRNAFYKLHNGEDILLLTTCRHGKKWREIQDQRCAKDHELYERYDYHELLHNSTFCLAPRGRRLGSFRFLESLAASCIPVLLSNGYELPFSEVIDWKRALQSVDERRLFEVGLILNGVHDKKIVMYRQQDQFLWEAYFSSVEKIISTVIEIMHHRVQRQVATSYNTWNNFPGTLVSLPNNSGNDISWPSANDPFLKFTAVLLVKSQKTKNVLELSRNISDANCVEKILVIWGVNTSIPDRSLWPSITEIVKEDNVNSCKDLKWKHYIKTEAVFYLDNFVHIQPTEIDLAFSVWKTFPNRIAGLFACSHFWNEKSSQWTYTAKLGVHHTNGYSLILPSAAFFHRYYIQLHAEYFPKGIQSKIESYDGCLDISLNFLIAHVTRLPPIKVLQHDPTRTKHSTPPVKYSVRNACFQLMKDAFGYVPLLYSKIVFVNDSG